MQRAMQGMLAIGLLLLTGCAHRPADDPADPLEPINRAVFVFNEKADKYALRPVAVGYTKVVPAPARTGITNFFNNIDEPRNALNALLQAKFTRSAKSLGRLLLNSTAGLAGFFDVATEVGLERQEEGFGQTLGYWGVGEGWYLMLPLLGPSSNRDVLGFAADSQLNPSFLIPGRYDVYTLSANGTNLINTRAGFLSADGILEQQFDRYLFVRTAYLQQRWNLIHDGNPPLEDYELTPDDPAPDAIADPATEPPAVVPSASEGNPSGVVPASEPSPR